MDSSLPVSPWPRSRRLAASVLIAFHLGAVVVAPWSSPPPAPAIAGLLATNLEWYLVGGYLNHGYRFFAPDPGPSHIVRYELTRRDGTVVRGQLPDPQANRPRLLYHRFFMTTETLFNTWRTIETIPADAPVRPEVRAAVEAQNGVAQSMVNELSAGLARQLLRSSDAVSVQLYLVEHSIPLPEDVANGRPLNDPDLYLTLADLGRYEAGQP